MRIVGGEWAGTALTSPSGPVRPTAETLREMCMQMLGDEVRDARLLDLFAGSGAIGLEALSRGAKSCDFVENAPAALHSLKANIAKVRARTQTRIFKRDAIQFVDRLAPDSYDIAFADPPYGSRKLDLVLNRWLAAPFSRILVLEHAKDHALPVRGTSRRFEDSVATMLRQRGGPKARRASP